MGRIAVMRASPSAAEVELREPDGTASVNVDAGAVLKPDALAFIVALQREFGRARRDLLAARAARQGELDAGATLDFDSATRAIRGTGASGER